MAWLQNTVHMDLQFATDACLDACGGVMRREFFKIRFPPEIRALTSNIAHLEMLALIAGLKVWKEDLHGKYIKVQVDNESVYNYQHGQEQG